MIFQFHFRGADSTFSYVVATSESHDAIIVDPLEECIDDYAALFEPLGYTPRFTLETGAVPKAALAAAYLGAKWRTTSVVPADLFRSGAPLRVAHRDRLRLVGLNVEVIGRPGGPARAVSYRIGDRVFVGSRQVRDESELLALPSDLLVYRSQLIRGTHFGLLGLEAGSALIDRDRNWSRSVSRSTAGDARRALPRSA